MKPKTKIIVAISIACLIIGLVVLDVVLSRKQTPTTDNTGTTSTTSTENYSGTSLDWSRVSTDTTFNNLQTNQGTNVVPVDDFGKSDLAKTDTRGTAKVNPLDPFVNQTEMKKPAKGLTENFDAAVSGGKEYEIQQGDTFASISKKFFGTEAHWPAIAKANPNMKPESLKIGAKITIPDAPEDVKFEKSSHSSVKKGERELYDGGKTYTVRPGDSLWSIASKNYKNNEVAMMIKKIVALNPDKLKNENTTLKIGWKLVLP